SLNPIPTDKFDAIISAGSYLAPINLTLSKRLNAKSICIMTPENISLKNFDLIIVPSHDVIRYPRLKKLQNIFVTTCAPNCITPDKLKMGIKNISDRLDFSDTKVRIGILIGGNDQNYFIDRKWAERFLETLEKLASVKHFSYLISTSRRTPTDVVQFLIEKTTKPYFIYREFVGISSASNYFGILGICDILLVTEDSVTMISEACSTGKPVVVVGSGKRKKKLAFDTTIENLVRNNYCFYVPAKQLDRLPDTIIKSLEHNFSLLEDTQKCALKIAEILNIKKS
ncbi:MAG TPA: ELM1/GtrOC1 family putative glycosyltransferase, partial [bacterium]|nr:ELM1/GtrOC1 family putative glycosyltransferase [bacterium]